MESTVVTILSVSISDDPEPDTCVEVQLACGHSSNIWLDDTNDGKVNIGIVATCYDRSHTTKRRKTR